MTWATIKRRTSALCCQEKVKLSKNLLSPLLDVFWSRDGSFSFSLPFHSNLSGKYLSRLKTHLYHLKCERLIRIRLNAKYSPWYKYSEVRGAFDCSGELNNHHEMWTDWWKITFDNFSVSCPAMDGCCYARLCHLPILGEIQGKWWSSAAFLHLALSFEYQHGAVCQFCWVSTDPQDL